MELNIDLSSLWANARQMTKHRVEITLEKLPELDLITSTQGVAVEIDEIDFLSQKFATYRGKQVLLYIPDHSAKSNKSGYETVFEATLDNPSEGNKFHLTNCKKLEEMNEKNRTNRYYATTNTSGKFTISNKNGEYADVELCVCKLCLMKLNYLQYAETHSYNKQRIFNEFNIKDFFTHYQINFNPKLNTAGMDPRNAGSYPKNWDEISKYIRNKRGWKCESCRLNLKSYPRLLHVHHIDGNKQNNAEKNFKVLCIKCHSEQDMHDHMDVSPEQIQILERLAREQRLK